MAARYYASYGGAHKQVRQLRGRARDHVCIKCGKPAHEWAYQGGAPDEALGFTDTSQNRALCDYSMHPEFYAPMCRKCHRAKDARPDRSWVVTRNGRTLPA